MEGGTRRSSGDLWSGIALALLGATIVAQAWQWDYSGPEGPGPGFFPLWYGLAMLALSLLLVASRFRSAPLDRKPLEWRRIGRALGVWVALAVCVGLFGVLGFVLGLALLTYFIAAVMYKKPAWKAAGVAAATAAGFYLVFEVALGLGLPTGVLGF